MKNSSICDGDFGSPMMYYSMGKWYLYGLTSMADGNETYCNNKFPSFFQIVPKFVNNNRVSFPGKWIQLNSDKSFNYSTNTLSSSTKISQVHITNKITTKHFPSIITQKKISTVHKTNKITTKNFRSIITQKKMSTVHKTSKIITKHFFKTVTTKKLKKN